MICSVGFLLPVPLLASSDFGSMLSVSVIHFEDRFCRQGEVGGDI